MKKEELMRELEEEIFLLQKKLDHPISYNLKMWIVQLLIKSGIALDFAFPYIVSACILLYTPVGKLNIGLPAIATVQTSSGDVDKSIVPIQNAQKRFEYSTAWKKNDVGLFERTITYYEPNFKDISTIEDILKKKKEELNQLFSVVNEVTIAKKVLTEEDLPYKEDVVTITTVSSFAESVRFQRLDQLLENLFFVLFVGVVGNQIRTIRKRIIPSPYASLKQLECKYELVTEENALRLSQVLLQKQENLALLTPDSEKTLKKVL